MLFAAAFGGDVTESRPRVCFPFIPKVHKQRQTDDVRHIFSRGDVHCFLPRVVGLPLYIGTFTQNALDPT